MILFDLGHLLRNRRRFTIFTFLDAAQYEHFIVSLERVYRKGSANTNQNEGDFVGHGTSSERAEEKQRWRKCM